MSQEIAVVGGPEFTTGFKLAGVRRNEIVQETDKSQKLDAVVEEVLKDEKVGIVVMHQEDLAYLSRGVRKLVEESVEPTVVTLGSIESSGLREQIKRAIGIDLMSD
tara:strand:+ start:4129 stop:4446 length:318 start_codon:yes stop_codon:yes gene_type:complete